MNSLFNLLLAASLAFPTSIIISFLYYMGCAIVVNCFKYNYGNENYWIFSHAVVILVISWIISFGLYIIFLEREL